MFLRSAGLPTGACRRQLHQGDTVDGGSEGRSIWARLGHFFGHNEDESLERAIIDARAEGEVEAEEESMLLGILRFNDLKVEDTMTPRTDIDCVSQNATIREAVAAVIASGHSRIPIYKDTRDNIVGIVHAKDLLSCLAEPDQQDRQVSSIMREPFFVPETKNIRTLLQEFRTQKQHIAIALDEYGGTSGLITIEDVLEEIVGDIQDEHDKPSQEDIRDMGQGVYEMSGRAFLEDLAELGMPLQSDEVDTIGGYLSTEAGHVPAAGETFTVEGWKFTILDADKKHIKKLSACRAAQEEAS